VAQRDTTLTSFTAIGSPATRTGVWRSRAFVERATSVRRISLNRVVLVELRPQLLKRSVTTWLGAAHRRSRARSPDSGAGLEAVQVVDVVLAASLHLRIVRLSFNSLSLPPGPALAAAQAHWPSVAAHVLPQRLLVVLGVVRAHERFSVSLRAESALRHRGPPQLRRKLKELKDSLYNSEVQTSGPGRHPLPNRFQDRAPEFGLRARFGLAQPPSQGRDGALQRLGAARPYLTRFNEILRTDVAAFNETARSARRRLVAASHRCEEVRVGRADH